MKAGDDFISIAAANYLCRTHRLLGQDRRRAGQDLEHVLPACRAGRSHDKEAEDGFRWRRCDGRDGSFHDPDGVGCARAILGDAVLATHAHRRGKLTGNPDALELTDVDIASGIRAFPRLGDKEYVKGTLPQRNISQLRGVVFGRCACQSFV